MGIGEPYFYQLFLSVALVSMLITPLLMTVSTYVAKWVTKLPFCSALLKERKLFFSFTLKTTRPFVHEKLAVFKVKLHSSTSSTRQCFAAGTDFGIRMHGMHRTS